jgi:anti-anti-sigma regulatory factor
MSNNTENTDTNTSDDSSSLIGVDPLAWLSEEEKETLQNHNNETTENNGDGEQENSSCLIKLNSAITIRDVSDLLEELNNISADKNELIFESNMVERVDTAALQLLLGFYLFAIDAGKKVVWDKPSEALCKAVNMLGLNDVIDFPSVTT